MPCKNGNLPEMSWIAWPESHGALRSMAWSSAATKSEIRRHHASMASLSQVHIRRRKCAMDGHALGEVVWNIPVYISPDAHLATSSTPPCSCHRTARHWRGTASGSLLNCIASLDAQRFSSLQLEQEGPSSAVSEAAGQTQDTGIENRSAVEKEVDAPAVLTHRHSG